MARYIGGWMNRHIVSGLLAALITGSVFATTLTGASAHTATTKSKDTPQSLAKKSSGNLVTSRAPQLKVGASDKFKLTKVWSGQKGLQYSAYERTYKGLPVHGGDFVVTTDSKGRILGTSVAQKSKIGAVSTKAGVSKSNAAAVARKTLRASRTTGTPTLVVEALDSPRLAWKVNVSGTNSHGDHEGNFVYVDAQNAKILRTDNRVLFGTGTGATNGPSPLHLDTTSSGGTFSLKDPNIANVDCRDDGTGIVFSGPDDVWGNGTNNRETGCVDALFAVQTESKMLHDWFGRNSLNGNGGGWKYSVGDDIVNAFYCPPGDIEPGYCDGTEQVRIGHNQAGSQWLTSLDVLGHENGHGVDTNTPGGISGGNTQEFVGDVFGSLTEAYANEPAPYDTPDYTVGEEIDLLGDGKPFRTMYDPSVNGNDNCYSSGIPGEEVHDAAGPGNHWFYLLAEGTAPAGKPASPTCNSTSLTGVGIQAAGKIFYNAMLMKTSASSYLKYRTWTLTAAKNLYPGDCTNFNKVKAAWNAVSVPAQSADPTCTDGGPGTNTVTVTNPGNKTGTVGTALSIQLTGSSTGTGQTLAWSATGLPAGTSINATTGLISGTPTTNGTYTVTATAKDTTNAAGSTSFTITISGGGSTGGQLLLNPGFESGTASWGGTTGVILDSTYATPHGGSKFAYFGGNGRSASENLTQSVSIPASATAATLSYWVKISTVESGSTAYDTLKVQVISGGTTSTKATYSNANAASGYVQKTVDLTAFKGKTITVKFLMTEDSSLQTTFLTDDTALTIS